MTNSLHYLWPVLEAVTPVVSAGAMGSWPKVAREGLVAAGLLKAAGTVTYVRCPACDRVHREKVVTRRSPDGGTRYYVRCQEVGRAEVRPEDLRQYTADVSALVERLCSNLTLSGPWQALATDRIWYCGRLNWHDGWRDVLFARGLRRQDVNELRPASALMTMLHPLVLVPTELPADDFWGNVKPLVLQLSRVATLGDDGLALDKAILTALIRQAEEREAAAYVFLRRGKQWQLTFEGKTAPPIRNSPGLTYISYLLTKPERLIPAVTLLAARAAIDPRVAKGSAGEQLTAAGRKCLQGDYGEMLQELEVAKARNDLGQVALLQSQLEQIQAEVRRATGARGRGRSKTDANKVRTAVSMAVSRAIDEIQQVHKELARHLRASIHPGYDFRYCPERPINWLA